MGSGHTPLAGGHFVEGVTVVLDHLAVTHPDIVWAVARTVPAGLEVVEVRDPDDDVRAGALLDRARFSGDVLERPLLGASGDELGVLWALDRSSSGVLDEQAPLTGLLTHLLTLVLLADTAHVASARRSEVLHEQAHTDELTGLPNRRGWAAVLAAEQSRYAAGMDGPSVLVIDLDRLKEINDVQGHVAGDEYIQLAGATLAAACRDGDVVARLGGDEFGVLVDGAGEQAAEPLVGRIREALDAAGVAASIGAAHHEGDGGLVGTWWRADRAMYAEKQRGRRVVDVRSAPPTLVG